MTAGKIGSRATMPIMMFMVMPAIIRMPMNRGGHPRG